MASNIDVGLDVSREQEKFLKKVKHRERKGICWRKNDIYKLMRDTEKKHEQILASEESEIMENIVHNKGKHLKNI